MKLLAKSRTHAGLYTGLYIWLVLVAAAAGCQRSDGPTRFDVTGSIRFRGQPVPQGEIVFRPDDTAGNDGPGSFARITNGRYQTHPGKGVVGGAYVVEIIGFDGIASEESSVGSPLCDPVTLRVDFPKQASTRDFDLP